MSVRSAHLIGFDFKALVRGAKALALAWQRRRMVGRLGTLDDHLLADIGITRQDVLSALAGSLFDDPSDDLAVRADEARRARRAWAADAVRQGRLIDGGPHTSRAA